VEELAGDGPGLASAPGAAVILKPVVLPDLKNCILRSSTAGCYDNYCDEERGYHSRGGMIAVLPMFEPAGSEHKPRVAR
jgi:hypothetical protein